LHIKFFTVQILIIMFKKLYLVREFKSEHEDMHYRNKNKSFKNKDEIVEDSSQN